MRHDDPLAVAGRKDSVQVDPSGSGIRPRLTKGDLFVPYEYRKAERVVKARQQAERALLAALTVECDELGLLWHHDPDSRRGVGSPGFPDLVVAGPGGFMIAELKSGNGRMSREQIRWRACLQHGFRGYALLRPEHHERGDTTRLLLQLATA